MRQITLSVVFLVSAFLPGPVWSQESDKCGDDAHRQFDFLLGHWEVRDRKGNKLGENRIEKSLGGCVIREAWSGRGNHIGHGISIYDRRRQLWHQTWVDNSGFLMVLEGELQGGVMVMNGRLQYDLQGREKHRVSWKPLDPDRLQRLWEMSRDGGNSWRTAAELIYLRMH